MEENLIKYTRVRLLNTALIILLRRITPLYLRFIITRNTRGSKFIKQISS